MKRMLALSLMLISGCAKDSLESPKTLKGDQGIQGTQGTGCSITTVQPGGFAPNGGALITCGIDSVLVTNGATGAQGLTAPPTPYSIAGFVNPCGDALNIYDEILIRLSTGQLIASFSDHVNGNNTRLSEITDGSYVTTDGNNCHFNVLTTGNTRTISWAGGSESWSI